MKMEKLDVILVCVYFVCSTDPSKKRKVINISSSMWKVKQFHTPFTLIESL
jgi:hypothetical protein